MGPRRLSDDEDDNNNNNNIINNNDNSDDNSDNDDDYNNNDNNNNNGEGINNARRNNALRSSVGDISQAKNGGKTKNLAIMAIERAAKKRVYAEWLGKVLNILYSLYYLLIYYFISLFFRF